MDVNAVNGRQPSGSNVSLGFRAFPGLTVFPSVLANAYG
jgi:hypothetical protein